MERSSKKVTYNFNRPPEMALKDAICDSIVTLVVLYLQLGYDVEECLKIAYNNIKDRKGKMVNGTFVKERAKRSHCLTTGIPNYQCNQCSQ